MYAAEASDCRKGGRFTFLLFKGIIFLFIYGESGKRKYEMGKRICIYQFYI